MYKPKKILVQYEVKAKDRQGGKRNLCARTRNAVVSRSKIQERHACGIYIMAANPRARDKGACRASPSEKGKKE